MQLTFTQKRALDYMGYKPPTFSEVGSDASASQQASY
jgi:hypothetical protein